MDSLYILIPVAMIFTLIAILAYLWAVNSGQYEDLEKEASQILFDDDNHADPTNDKNGLSHHEETPK